MNRPAIVSDLRTPRRRTLFEVFSSLRTRLTRREPVSEMQQNPSAEHAADYPERIRKKMKLRPHAAFVRESHRNQIGKRADRETEAAHADAERERTPVL